MTSALVLLTLVVAALGYASAFGPARFGSVKPTRSVTGARSMTAVFDSLASVGLAAQLNSASLEVNSNSNSLVTLSSRSFPVAVKETVQGMYKEYTVDRIDDSALDEVRRGYKTAEETEESKSKYWAIFAVLIFGSFAIPMAQYFWYVAEED